MRLWLNTGKFQALSAKWPGCCAKLIEEQSKRLGRYSDAAESDSGHPAGQSGRREGRPCFFSV
jgi:hypothetical protein